ncbi:TIGR02147 family protein [Bdellovibrio sp. BCCA]|uniref:TIGR02147 family protein n=1 Tax=Bdellovibrio sp. BCCA TaxID=3136281 RepID=UPI0030F0F388
MVENHSSLSIFLQDVLETRRLRNPKYSMRAFARDLGLSPGRLSDLLSGRRLPGKELRSRIVNALKMSEDESKQFLNLIEKQKLLVDEKGDAHQLSEDEFALIADWENYAVMMLMGTHDFRSHEPWMAERLGISESRIRKALERLHRLNLIKLEKGLWERTHHRVTTTHDVPSQILRESHRQILEQAIASLMQDDPAIRDITSITIPSDPEKIPEAKKIIRDFRRKMTRLLTEGRSTEVYNLNIQLVPVTKVRT